ncbi:MAG: VanW family protein, partial [Oscillospiraceae bacterium]|nr:VanW family protein [Oscillospiraceae bacterium]
VDDRTHNLMLACEAINGKVVMPGEIFSFNEAVGERTAAKGYREATAYVSGASVPEIGGGVCQVASSIYYAVLQADLYTVERHAHTYLVTYVPKGMDAAIYWGALDYKFENSSPYPIKIEADVSDGEVHVILRGTEWKDYTVKLSWKQLEEVPYETKTRVVTDGSYKDGDVIVSPYTGYTITTYKTLIDRDDNPIETVKIKTSVYSKRDRVVAVVPKNEPEPQPTETP